VKALVLGGNGFIGSHVVDALLAEGHSVRVFDRAPEKFRSPLQKVDYRLSALDDTPALSEALEDIDVVYHLISTTVPSTSNKDPIYDIESNLKGTVRLLNLMRDSGVRRIIYLSSGGTVYGVPEVSPIPETHPLRPICSYGVVKVAIENYLQMYQALYGIDAVILRASNPYGERQGHAGVQGVIGTFMGKIKAGQDIEIWGDGSVVRDYIYVKDLAELCVCAGNSAETGIFNAGAGEGQSVRQVFDAVIQAANVSIEPTFKVGRAYDVPEVVLNIKKSEAAFNWRPLTCFGEGLDVSWSWLEGA